MAVEDLRKWEAWDHTEHILGLYGRTGFNVPVIKRSILRFALSCPPSHAQAAAFVAARRKEDPQYVDEVIELLRYESPKPAAASTTKKP